MRVTIALRALLVCATLLVVLQHASTARASGSGVSALDPGDTGVGLLIGAAVLPTVLLAYAVAGVEYHELLIPEPLAWIQLGVAAAALTSAIAYQGPSYAVEPALGVGGFMLAVHALISLIWYDDAQPANEAGAFAVRASRAHALAALAW